MKMLKLLFLLTLLWIPSGFSEERPLPPAVMTKSDEFVKALFTQTPDEIYGSMGGKSKAQMPPNELKAALKLIQDVIAKPQTICRISGAQFHPDVKAFSLVYDVILGKKEYDLKVVITSGEKAEEYFVEGAHLRDKPRKLSDFREAGFSRYLIWILFASSVLGMLASFIYFGFYKKWWKAASALVGFPCGMGLNWTTGAVIYRFGINLPPAGFSHPAHGPDYWTITVFIPLGLLLMILDLLKKKRQPENGGTA